MLYETDTVELPPVNTDVRDDASLVENINILDKQIPNIFNNFVLYYDLKEIEGFTIYNGLNDDDIMSFKYLFLSKIDAISSKWVYNQENLNKSYIDNTIIFNAATVIANNGIPTIRVNPPAEGYCLLDITINSISYDDNYLNNIQITKNLTASYLDIPFVNPITRLAIYGATPIYK